MTFFHEMYGRYFRIVSVLLRRESCTEAEIRALIVAEGFGESVLFLPQKLIPQADGSDWGLLRRTANGRLEPVTRHLPMMPVTAVQKRWLRAKLNDPRLRLFLDDTAFAALSETLRDVPPLYLPEWFRFPDRFSDGDPYTQNTYRAHFRTVLQAVHARKPLAVRFRSGRGAEIYMHCMPLYLEYSAKNDKFRLCCIQIRNGQMKDRRLINLGRIEGVRPAETEITPTQESPEAYFASRRCQEPVVVRVTEERNGVERFLMEFAPYQKQTERDPETGTVTVQLWYDKLDETELLIRLLSFGPVLEILGPPAFRQQAADRIARQYEYCRVMQIPQQEAADAAYTEV